MTKYELNYSYKNFDDAIDVAQDVVEYLNKGEYDDLDTAIFQEVDRYLIWTANQWDLMKEYQSPEDANLQDAIEDFMNEIYSMIDEVEVDDEEEDDENIIEDFEKYEKKSLKSL